MYKPKILTDIINSNICFLLGRYMDKQKFIKEFEKAKEINKPKPKYVKNALIAFTVGGFICIIAQIFNNAMLYFGLGKTDASLLTTVFMVFIGSALTGIGIYDKIGKVAGAGSIVPITGFANSVVSCALEFRAEGAVFGIGAKMFTVAGPVIVFGTLTNWIVGLIYFIVSRV